MDDTLFMQHIIQWNFLYAHFWGSNYEMNKKFINAYSGDEIHIYPKYMRFLLKIKFKVQACPI